MNPLLLFSQINKYTFDATRFAEQALTVNWDYELGFRLLNLDAPLFSYTEKRYHCKHPYYRYMVIPVRLKPGIVLSEIEYVNYALIFSDRQAVTLAALFAKDAKERSVRIFDRHKFNFTDLEISDTCFEFVIGRHAKYLGRAKIGFAFVFLNLFFNGVNDIKEFLVQKQAYLKFYNSKNMNLDLLPDNFKDAISVATARRWAKIPKPNPNKFVSEAAYQKALNKAQVKNQAFVLHTLSQKWLHNKHLCLAWKESLKCH